MTNAICQEIIDRCSELKDKSLTSIYFGGGTPSLLTANELELILTTIRSKFLIQQSAEITLEANPDDIRADSLKTWNELGINRLSIGLQSFNDEELKWMNRSHTADESVRSVHLAQGAGFENLSIDLIYGSKFQSMESWEKTLQQAVDLKTPHISAYHLTIEERTLLGTNFKKRIEPAIDDELGAKQFLIMSEFLRSNAFVHYEISNFGKNGYEAVHNSSYWKNHPYLGIGPSAHSFDGNERRWNVSNNEIYIQKLSNDEIYYETETLTHNNRFNEFVMTGLRTNKGCSLSEIESRFGNNYKDHFTLNVKKFLPYFNVEEGIYYLDLKGKLLADRIASELFVTDSTE